MSPGILVSPEKLFRQALAACTPVVCFYAKRSDCGGPIQAHHVIPRKHLRRIAEETGIPESVLISDARNGIFVCERHHHAVEKLKTLRLRRGSLPARFTAFEQQFDTERLFHRIYVRPFDHSPARERDADTSGHRDADGA